MATDALQTMRQLAFPTDLNLKPSGITLPTIEGRYELKTDLIQLMSKFHGILEDDPITHLRDFEMICSTEDNQASMGEYIRLLLFLFTLQGSARKWYYGLTAGSVTTWAEMQQKFLERYYSAAKVFSMRRTLQNIKQGELESFYEYWSRFKGLLEECPHHQIPEYNLVEYFITGLKKYEKKLVIAACGGSMFDKTPKDVLQVIECMATKLGAYECNLEVPKNVENGNLNELKKEIMELKQLVVVLITPENVRQCGPDHMTEHQTDGYTLSVGGGPMEDVAMGENDDQHEKYDPFSHSYNVEWSEDPSSQWGYGEWKNQQLLPVQGIPQTPSSQPEPQEEPTWEELMEAIAKDAELFESETKVGIDLTEEADGATLQEENSS
ncbi:uncharacterized protein LOC131023126 [Salvia miltiorrhiza]|uniref:uncharacterized protein LOC131023126 n=1 Tax=Salvia miltiorrhiza TaxID=226208 RepID=UPI0025AD2884|nr:uncharacterized protein LOC131023126 [Salvia miltiorrhiza]